MHAFSVPQLVSVGIRLRTDSEFHRVVGRLVFFVVEKMQEAFDCLYYIDLDFVNKSGAIALYSLLCLFVLEHILKLEFSVYFELHRAVLEEKFNNIQKMKMVATKNVLKRILRFFQTIFSQASNKTSPKHMSSLETLEAKVSSHTLLVGIEEAKNRFL